MLSCKKIGNVDRWFERVGFFSVLEALANRDTTILERIKWNSKPPFPPQSKDEATQKPKGAIFPTLIWGGGWGGGGCKCPIYFVQDCRFNWKMYDTSQVRLMDASYNRELSHVKNSIQALNFEVQFLFDKCTKLEQERLIKIMWINVF